MLDLVASDLEDKEDFPVMMALINAVPPENLVSFLGHVTSVSCAHWGSTCAGVVGHVISRVFLVMASVLQQQEGTTGSLLNWLSYIM